MDQALPQMDNLIKINDSTTDESYGYYPYKRPIKNLLNYGLILLDKPPGHTSHEIVSYVKKILGLEKAGHSGTLDPGYYWFIADRFGRRYKNSSRFIIGTKGICDISKNS